MQEPARLWDYATEICALAWSEAVMRSGELHDLPIIGLAPRPGVTRRIVPCAHPAKRARALGAKAKPCSAHRLTPNTDAYQRKECPEQDSSGRRPSQPPVLLVIRAALLDHSPDLATRSEESRVGKEWVCTGRSRRATYH